MNQLIVITGASQGIGLSTARLFAKEGYSLALIARNQNKLLEIKSELQSSLLARGGRVEVYSGDVGVAEDVEKIADRIQQNLGVPDILIHCAGAGIWRFVTETTTDEALSMLKAPFLGSFFVTRAFLPEMLKRNSGQIINLSTPASVLPWPGATFYASMRWAVTGFSKALKADLYGNGIKVALLLPGEIESSYWENNPGSRHRLPLISKFVPTITCEDAAKKILKVVRNKTQGDVFFPFQLRLLNLMVRFFPRLSEWIVNSTGYTVHKASKGR